MPPETSLQAPVLVTGAAGFIGRHLIAALLERGVAARALLLRGESVPETWHDALEGGQLTVHRGDVTEPTSLAAPCDGVGTVVHLAAVVTDWGPEALFRRVTVGGTDNVLRAAAAGAPSGTSVRCVLASSIVVYGTHLRHRACPEDTPFGSPVGVYSRAKQAQEALARELAPKLGLELAVVRPANVFGLGSRPWQEMVAPLLETRQITLIDGGDFDAGLVHVRNLCDLLLAAAAVLGTPDRDLSIPTYNAVDGFGITWRQYFGDLSAALGAPPPRSAPRWLAAPGARLFEAVSRLTGQRERPLLTREALNLVGSHLRLPSDRARTELGWSPRVGYDEAIAEIHAGLAADRA
ncbi:MAG: NAD-dependent epimerase/dehydratase family protein [Acidobacteriota bacterium]